MQALYAFGRGGLFGEGLGQSLLPTAGGRFFGVETDFIFAVIAEELGVIGACALLALTLALVFRGLRVAILARDDFSAMLAVGLTVSLGLQTLIITAGIVKLIPLTGITFPFVSYGGSSLLASFIIIGLLLAISHRSAVAVRAGGPRTVIADPCPAAGGLPRPGLRPGDAWRSPGGRWSTHRRWPRDRTTRR